MGEGEVGVCWIVFFYVECNGPKEVVCPAERLNS